MPLLSNGGHTCSQTKRSDSSNKLCRALPKDHLTVNRCPFLVLEVTCAEKN